MTPAQLQAHRKLLNLAHMRNAVRTVEIHDEPEPASTRPKPAPKMDRVLAFFAPGRWYSLPEIPSDWQFQVWELRKKGLIVRCGSKRRPEYARA